MSIPPYYGKTFKCLVCGEPTEAAPYGGVFLSSTNGNYGSAVWDGGNGPSGGVEAFIHDACFVAKVKDGTILAIRKGREVKTKEPDEIIAWDPSQIEDYSSLEDYEK